MFEVIVNCICQKCNKQIDSEDAEIFCTDCYDNDIDEGMLMDCIELASKTDYIWKDRELYIGFENEEEKTTYLEGIEKGYFDALFSICSYFGMDEFFSKNICDKFFIKDEK